MKKIILLLSFISFACAFAQKKVIPSKPANTFAVVYPEYTETEKFIKKFRSDYISGKLPVNGGQQKWLADGATLTGKTADSLDYYCRFGKLTIEEEDTTGLSNSRWLLINPPKYGPCGFTTETVWVLKSDGERLCKVTSSKKINGKIQPCFNWVWDKSQNTQFERDEVVYSPPLNYSNNRILNETPVASEISNQNTGGYTYTAPLTQGFVMEWTNATTFVFPNTVVTDYDSLQIPNQFVSNITYSNPRSIRNDVQPNQPTTTWGGTPFSANTTGTGTTETVTWGGTGFSGNLNGNPTNGEVTPVYNGGNFSGNGTVPGVNEYLRQGQNTGRR